MNDVLRAALEYLRVGFAPIPVPKGSKRPVEEGWPDLRLTEDDLPRYFSPGTNVGLLTGKASGGLIDVDLDCDEAVRLADAFLPMTAMQSGHASRSKSHRWCKVKGPLQSLVFKDVDTNKTTLLELRSDGHQTLVPPSVHPDGETYVWHGELEPATVDGADLEHRVHRLAAATLAARHWPRAASSRHHIANAFAGMLLRGGWDVDEVAHFIGTVSRAAGDEEAAARAKDATATARTLGKGRKATGRPLEQLVGSSVVDQLCEWLDLSQRSVGVADSNEPGPDVIGWPEPLDEVAYMGLAGRFVRLVGPHTEADPAAVLVQFIVAFGNVIGRKAYFAVEADRHFANLFAAIVGVTAKGRKGTSWGQVKSPFGRLDSAWAVGRVLPGLSSGEGLIWAVRDEIVRRDPVKHRGRVIDYEEVVADPGVDDKRLMVLEPELASTLRIIGREGNTLSAIMRQAWEIGNLRTLTKHSPAVATDAHVSIVGHITKSELLRHLDSTEIANGLANRFVWICAHRSKLLPEGGQLDRVDFTEFDAELKRVVEFAAKAVRLERDAEAREIWRAVYPELSAGQAGLFGAIVSRAEAQVTRLSCIYALMDASTVIRKDHLLAALAVWEYAEASARFIFGSALGDPLADEILRALRRSPNGLTRTEIRDLFGRNRNAFQIGRALGVLVENGLAHSVNEETDGRPAERWFATAPNRQGA